jgi:hypothetical protein
MLSTSTIRRSRLARVGLVALGSLAIATPAHAAGEPGGVTARLSTDASASFAGKHANLRLHSIMLRWNKVEPQPGQFQWGQLDASLRDAKAKNYKVIIRLMCGSDAPAFVGNDTPILRLVATDGAKRALRVPLPWHKSLLAHYQRLMAGLNQHLLDTGLGDRVYFVTSGMPTELGTEMPMGYGRAGQAAANKRVWLANSPVKGTEAARTAANRTALENAWYESTKMQLETLTAAPSALALGGLFGDGYQAANRLVDRLAPIANDRLYIMTTNLQPKMVGGKMRPWAEWNPGAAKGMRRAAQLGMPVGFQTAAEKIISTPAKMQYSIRDGLTYGMKFLEVSPSMADRYASVLTSAQTQIMRLQ